MPIIFKSPLTSQGANDTFLDKTIDDIKKGKLGLYKVAIGESGEVTDVQDYTNEIANVTGMTGEGDVVAKTYSSEQVIANGDDRKVAIGKLDAQVKTNLDNITSNTDLILINTKQITSQTAYDDLDQIALSATIAYQEFRLVGNAAPVTLNALPFTIQPANGAEILLVGHDDINTIRINDNNLTQFGCYLNGDAILGKYNMITLVYNSELERFIEKTRNF